MKLILARMILLGVTAFVFLAPAAANRKTPHIMPRHALHAGFIF